MKLLWLLPIALVCTSALKAEQTVPVPDAPIELVLPDGWVPLPEKAMDRYQKVIELQQQQLREAGENRLKLEELLDELKEDLKSLRQLPPGSPGQKQPPAAEGGKK